MSRAAKWVVSRTVHYSVIGSAFEPIAALFGHPQGHLCECMSAFFA
jgi:hypothetical protein